MNFIKTAGIKVSFTTIQKADASVQWEPTVNWGLILGKDKLAYLCSLQLDLESGCRETDMNFFQKSS